MEARGDVAKIAVVSQFLISKMALPGIDPLVQAAVRLIHQSVGTIRIADLAVQLSISQSPLEKRFRKAVGASPKKFASLVRLRRVLETSTIEREVLTIGYDAGYYDQAHFIHDFKAFTGQTPEQFFRNKEQLRQE
jgi:methylphosphotriester-DNA--protein-cysteine methyltransferase